MKKVSIKYNLGLEILRGKVRICCYEYEFGCCSCLDYDEVDKLITELKKAQERFLKRSLSVSFR